MKDYSKSIEIEKQIKEIREENEDDERLDDLYEELTEERLSEDQEMFGYDYAHLCRKVMKK